MIVTSYTPTVKIAAADDIRLCDMSSAALLTADRQIQMTTTAEGGGGGRVTPPQLASEMVVVGDNKDKFLLDQNTLVTYIYCFIKNFIGASGTNTVAIDNKIEQAMDLVKSHLMFAVREEVEVLKEKIAELMERINHLETENNILRANASEETLSQLKGPQGNNGGSGNPNPPNNNNNPSL